MMENEINIVKAVYIASAVRIDQYPEKKLREVVFIGRSNVGKSSLINSLCRVGGLARVSSTPGKTQTINFYELTAKFSDTDRREFYLVDLPGYGYAKTGKANRRQWSKFIEEYLLKSEQLQFVCQLIDSRHTPQPSDIEMFKWLVENNLPVLVIATKRDKISNVVLTKNIRGIKEALGVPDVDVLPYSAVKNTGRAELLDVIGSVLVE